MERETKHYVESLNHDPNWLNTITIEIDKFLINHEYINFFIIMYIQCIKDDGSTSSLPKPLHNYQSRGNQNQPSMENLRPYVKTESGENRSKNELQT